MCDIALHGDKYHKTYHTKRASHNNTNSRQLNAMPMFVDTDFISKLVYKFLHKTTVRIYSTISAFQDTFQRM